MLTFTEAHEQHKLLWGWLAETGGDDKYKWAGFDAIEEKNHPPCACFACLASRIVGEGRTDCDYCPIDWGYLKEKEDEDITCDCLQIGSLFYKWRSAYDKERRKKLAAKIRDSNWINKGGSNANSK